MFRLPPLLWFSLCVFSVQNRWKISFPTFLDLNFPMTGRDSRAEETSRSANSTCVDSLEMSEECRRKCSIDALAVSKAMKESVQRGENRSKYFKWTRKKRKARERGEDEANLYSKRIRRHQTINSTPSNPQRPTKRRHRWRCRWQTSKEEKPRKTRKEQQNVVFVNIQDDEMK